MNVVFSPAQFFFVYKRIEDFYQSLRIKMRNAINKNVNESRVYFNQCIANIKKMCESILMSRNFILNHTLKDPRFNPTHCYTYNNQNNSSFKKQREILFVHNV